MRREMTPTFITVFAAILTVIVLLALMKGCVVSVRERPLRLYIGVDASGSARPYLGVYALTAATLSERLHPGWDALSLYRVDNACQEFSSGETLGDAEATLQVIVTETKNIPDHARTLPALFWEQAARRTSQEKEGDAALLLVSDGDNDDLRPESERSIRRSVERLAKNPRVRTVILCGVAPANAERLRRMFAPLGARFRLILRSEMDPAKVAERLVAERRP